MLGIMSVTGSNGRLWLVTWFLLEGDEIVWRFWMQKRGVIVMIDMIVVGDLLDNRTYRTLRFLGLCEA
jgi:hypothetical protein